MAETESARRNNDMKEDDCRSPWGLASVPWHRRPLLTFGLVGGSGLIGLAVAAQFHGPAAPADAAAPVVAAEPTQTAPLPTAAGPSAAARWQGEQLSVDFDEVPLQQAITWLAQATHTTVTGAEWLQQSVPVTLHLRVGDIVIAWQQLLQRSAHFSITCSAAKCPVWITGAIAAPAPTPMPAVMPAGRAAPDSPADKASEELEMSQPGGSC